MDRCGFGPADNVEGDGLVGVAAQALDVEIAVSCIQRVADCRRRRRRPSEAQHSGVPRLARQAVGILWNYAGVSRHEGVLRLRVSNRENYNSILEKDGDTDILWQKLPNEMSLTDAAEHLADLPEFQSPEVLECLAEGALARKARSGSVEPDATAQARGQRLKYARELRGLKITEVGDRLGISKEAVWSHEYHGRMPRDGKLGEYAGLYRVSERWLREGGAGGPDDEGRETNAIKDTSSLSGAQLLALARSKLAEENRVDETCISIEVSIRLNMGGSRAA